MVTLEDAKEALWRRGELAWKLRPQQLPLYDLIAHTTARRYFLECARRFGKSFTLMLYSLERGLQNAKWLIRFAAPTSKDLEEIYHPIVDEICGDCPEELRPIWRQQKSHYWFPSTDSRLYLVGTDHENYKKLRGKALHLGVMDEVGSMDRAKHICDSILMPQTLTTGGRIFMASTPAETPGHDASELADACAVLGNYAKRTIYEAGYPPDVIEEYARDAGGKQTTVWRREYMCERVTEEARAIVPEFTSECAAAIVREFEVPPYFLPFEAMDVGGDDFTVVLFGYWDFLRAKLCVQDEVVMRLNRAGATTDVLAARVKAKEAELWGTRPVHQRWSDTNIILLNDLVSIHKLDFIPTLKDDKEAQVAEMRVWVKSQRIEIHPRCTTLRRHLANGIWNKARTEYQRTEVDGHYDAIDALIYMVRNTPRSTNPYPAYPAEVQPSTHWINPHTESTAEAAAFASMFRRH